MVPDAAMPHLTPTHSLTNSLNSDQTISTNNSLRKFWQIRETFFLTVSSSDAVPEKAGTQWGHTKGK